MKKNLLTIFCLLVTLSIMASPVSKQEARQKAAAFMQQKREMVRNHSTQRQAAAGEVKMTEAPYAAAEHLYLFNAEEGNGYVVVSGDDRTPAVLGYADHGTIDPQHMPDNMKAFLQNYEWQLAHLNAANAAPANTVQGEAIAPLMQSKWNQGWPYNNQTPCFPGTDSHTSTGCVATAMAQVMYYYQWPQQTTATIPAYYFVNHNEEWEVVDEIGITTIDWANMLPEYNGSATAEQQEAVATLMRLCGASVKMDYDGVSLAFSSEIATALVNYFDYDAGIRILDRGQYSTAVWNQMMYDELKAGRPIPYGGQSVGGGHAFVVDGYDSDDYFHVNWGWSGSCDGYFLLSILDPGSTAGIGASTSNDGYSYWQDAIVGIQPNQGTVPTLTTDRFYISSYEYTEDGECISCIPVEQQGIGRFESGYFECVLLYSHITNTTGADFESALGVFDAEGNLVDQGLLAQYLEYVEGEPATFFDVNANSVSDEEQYYCFGKDLPNGTYTLRMMSRKKGTETWAVNQGDDKESITLVIGEDSSTITSNNPTRYEEPVTVYDLSATLSLVGEAVAGDKNTLRLTVTNNGDDFTQDVILFQGNDALTGRYIDVMSGETASFDFEINAENLQGDVEYRVYDRVHDNVIASTTVNYVVPEAHLSVTATVKNQQEGIVSRNQATIGLSIKNEGDSDYKQSIVAILFKQADDGGFYYSADQAQHLNLAQNENRDVELTFGELEDGATYLVNVYYNSKGEMVICDTYPIFSVQFQEAQLSINPEVSNAVRYLDDGWTAVVGETSAKFALQVNNEGATDYNSELVLQLYKFEDDGLAYPAGEVSKQVQLSAGKSDTFELTADGLENGATYMVFVMYVSNGELVEGYPYTPYFTVDLTATGISTPAVASRQQTDAVYTIDGRRVSNTANLKRGIYIINGKKVSIK